MACTTQTALDYVTNARCNLVGELRGLSVILENLYQQRVLSDEAVSKVQAEKDDYDKNRTMLDFVIQSGEEACYKLLKIIYMTRKRNLRRDEASGETRRFDLHHWISCFSFKEDTEMDENYLQGPKPCHRYQKKLKSKAQKISKEFWTSSKTLFEENKKPVLSYTSLVLETQGRIAPSKIKKFKSKKSRMCRPKKLRTYVPENKLEISPSDLLKTHKNILLVGKPGIGKTALTLELLRLWSEGDRKELEYMFYFDMRETEPITSAKNLEDLLFSLYSEPDEGKDEVLQDIKTNSDNVKIIFDGLTDLSVSVVQRLVKKDLLPDAKIIMTCRPDDEDEDSLLEECLRVEVQGFSEQTIKTYLSATLGEDLEKVLSSVELLTLCHVPMYALMVAACFSSDDSTQPRTITEIYIHIVRFCLKTNNKTKTKHLNSFIRSRSKEILSLAETAFHATQKKNVNLEKLVCEDSCVLSFLKTLDIKVDVTETITTHAFLHYTVQEFFAAVWLLKNPDNIRDVFQQCLTEEQKHMKHLIPFMCRLMNEKSPSLMSCLIPVEDNNKTSKWFFKEMITTFSALAGTEDSRLDDDILFLCQCLYEYQCPEACIYLLDKLDFCLDLSGEKLDPYTCCAVAYVVTQSKERKIWLNLEDVTVSEEGMRRLFGCLENVQWCDPLPQQLWKINLLIGGQIDYVTSLGLDGNQLHLPVDGKSCLFERAVKIIQRMTAKVNVCLHWDREGPVCQSLSEALFEVLPNINSLSFRRTSRGPGSSNQEKSNETLERDQKELFLDLCLRTALCDKQRFHDVVNVLLSFFPIKTDFTNILLDLYQHVKSKSNFSLLPSIQSVFQSGPAVWYIKLSERKTSILLEVLKLQSEKKQVKLTDCSHEEREVRSFLQCLPYISQLSLVPQRSDLQEETRLFVNLFCAAAEREQQTGEKILKLLSSVCSYQSFTFHEIYMDDDDLIENQCDFLLDLYSQMKDCETKTGLSLLPSLQSVFQSGPAVWSIKLSERKTSILLEVLKLQSEKKQVELTDCSHEEREVRSFLQFLPYISQLSLVSWTSDLQEETRLFVNLFCAAAEREQQTGEKILKLLSSVCSYQSFPLRSRNTDDKYQCDFLLDLYSQMKDCETKTGLSLLPSLQSVFLSAPAVWYIKLSERKTSILLEVLKLQSEKKQVELTDCSHEEREVRSFLQCLRYISQLSLVCQRSNLQDKTRLFVNLFCAAAEREQQTGEKILKLLSSVCSYQSFPLRSRNTKYQCDFLLDLYSQMKDCETKTGLSLLPSLQSVFQSGPAVWSIKLSERKTSILLEVLKLQSEKKQVELIDCSHEEREVRSFLQCLPYISQLSLVPQRSNLQEETRLFVNLFCAAAEREQQTGEKILKLLSSVCSYQSFCLDKRYMDNKCQCDFLLDLYSQMKDCETKTGLSLLPSLQSVFQSAPAVWSIKLSERKTSILLEVLKLQLEKKQVELTDCSHEEREVRSFLQCLPYISELSLYPWTSDLQEETRLFVNLFCAAAEREQQTGEKILKLLSSVCSYQSFPSHERYVDDDDYSLIECQCDFLLDLYSQMKDCETKTGLSLLPSLQSVFQSGPAVWSIKLSERKTSILLEVLKLQSEKKQVKLTDCSHEEREVRSFLQCLPYISPLSCGPEFFQSVCSSIFVRSTEDLQQLVFLLQLLDFQLLLTGDLSRKTCCSVGRLLRVWGFKVDLTLTPSRMSVRGAALLFRYTTQLHSLKLSNNMTSVLLQCVRRGRLILPLAVEELYLVSDKVPPAERVLLKVVSSLASLLRYWTVGRLDLTESCIPAQSLITLLLHDAPLTLRLSEDNIQQLLVLLHEIQDENLSLSFLSKIGGDLTSCCLNWKFLHHLLQLPSAQTITVNLKKNHFLQETAAHLLPFLDRIVFKRPSPRFVRTSIREVYRAHASHMVPSLLRSLDHVINLNCTELDSVDCAALLFILKHSDRVQLKLLGTFIPAEEIKSILWTLDRVTDLSVDRNLLLRFIHCCAASDDHQEAASDLLRTLQHRLDLSCSSYVELPEEGGIEPLSLTVGDCQAVCTILRHIRQDTKLHLQDCEVEDRGLDLLFPVLHRVRLRVSKTVLVQLLSLLPVNNERDTVRRAVSLCQALGGELDLSHTTLDQRLCGALVQMLDSCEELTELDLSHCELTDQLLLQLTPHLHKVHVLDLSHNNITDASTDDLLQLVSINPSINTVRLFSNNIVNTTCFKKHKQFEMW
ncbi:uncharacterized protein LOC121635224 isoform X1 [Melanotaenia boesemani]|uniref:uncharacterized protein LOC121635224 isoform X1 n=1 Tax=Melanotaenia boesemani TaxID=1250792 RepID=UPI001C05687F|nr:uncharacterized protein LOC121635224 isoform X1 [Melanotaenia boesemani]XP_041834246.1 uncharacterized protein LOC121635224 isoform X1 [Melanotaenia boesemani]XP_041834247.1 uncharacterized protein LOC121635224 isoform X1 [Melanotaenia boesemani]XP_041834248.1 uncharacterized protein LOC121635224 isoform X1 [Melanotaenia boesemani]